MPSGSNSRWYVLALAECRRIANMKPTDPKNRELPRHRCATRTRKLAQFTGRRGRPVAKPRRHGVAKGASLSGGEKYAGVSVAKRHVIHSPRSMVGAGLRALFSSSCWPAEDPTLSVDALKYGPALPILNEGEPGNPVSGCCTLRRAARIARSTDRLMIRGTLRLVKRGSS